MDQEVAFLHKISTEINATLDLDQIASAVLRLMHEQFGFTHSLLLRLDVDG